tara:strand:+ start:289 stop:474 length:186 start_codon:yes stop_codon:yes gene_type:complete
MNQQIKSLGTLLDELREEHETRTEKEEITRVFDRGGQLVVTIYPTSKYAEFSEIYAQLGME